jgi:hypothetical protein
MLPMVLLLLVPLIHAQVETDTIIPDAHVTFTTIDVPGSGVTNVLGINSDGDMVGNYSTAYNTPSRLLKKSRVTTGISLCKSRFEVQRAWNLET